MARTRDSRSPSPAGSQYARRRKDDDRRDRRDDGGRDYRRRSRSRSPGDRRYRDRERDRDSHRRRDRSIDRRDDDLYRGGRRDNDRHRDNRRRSRDRFADRDRSLDRRRHRDGDRDHRPRRDDSRDRARARREGTADSRPRSRRDDSRPRGAAPPEKTSTPGNEAAKPKPAPAQTEADKKAERLARLEAWKKSRENKANKENEVNPSQTRNLLAEMDKKSVASPAPASPSVASPAVASPAVASPVASPAPTLNTSGNASPAVPFAGKFDPKAIAKKSAASHKNTGTNSVLGALEGRPEKSTAPVAPISKASALPANRNLSAFGFSKATADSEKLASKRKLDLDEEEGTKRKLTKLPALPLEADDTPYADQDEDDESDGGNFAETEEEAAAIARAAHERRERELQEAQEESKQDVDMQDAAPTQTADPVEEPPVADKMEVVEAEEDDVDPLDAFMADLSDTKAAPGPKASTSTKKVQEPEAYFSDDEYAFKADDGPNANAALAMAAKRKKKDIPTVDYSKIDLLPIRKDFWVEPAELAALSEEEVTELRAELDGIKVSGKNVPKPVQKWAQCGLNERTLDVIAGLGYEKPTPIQMQSLPILMSGRDVVAVARTGSGKTMAFLLPMFRHIMDQPPIRDTDGPIGLIMTPTRELAVQIHRDCKPFLKAMGLRAVCAYGGAPIRDQIAELKRGAEIVVCTPGRMIDLLAANQGRVTNVRRVTYAVLDEADRMFDMGFEPQVMKIFANIRPDRQTIMFSATMPRSIDSLAKKVLKSPVEITVGGRSIVPANITQIVEVIPETEKFYHLLGLLGELYEKDEDARTLIFVERQEKADDLLKELMTKGYPCMSIHGGKDQVDRDSTISDFKNGIVPILVATSVAARGLDVKQLKLVVNYDPPSHHEDMVHRSGRTGRAGNTGTAVTYISEDQENCAPGIAKALEQSGVPVPKRLEEMRKAWIEKVKAGKAKDNSGFGGKGLDRLDAEREAARLRERKTHKAEGEEDDVKEEKAEDKGKSAVIDIQSKVSAVVSRAANKPEEAKGKDAPAAGGAGGKPGQPLDMVSAAIRNINERLGKAGQLRSGQPIDNKGPDAGAYHATLEINDFPQKARWAVTNRTNVAKILEATGVSITTKGTFYPAGKEVPAGADPKLYILVEGDTEVVVGAAMTELTRLLSEGTVAAATADSRAPASGRYNVV
ncbi:DEAD/DEAH box helicase [Colletotrichum scovillei]|uniref:RNA helicase n=1 Tax=Colletotrichum scovillei TaxID=1209932 RepID=A0A9P7UF62_9PEZI|nr:DEAD/DEAH box helicase [Colletotrichum scovillei]KAF4782027.1 DEAD/DEAH box helicase [Colletotrichum scovillei]KAG7050357.1 pre-mRNA-processing ATP-dependent RNA helicase prp5 [Colletotrichum scovillei]KAG7069398.1 pre-mRNA-processing ATP-dependent RNA helicase prp5 [Colletotrichum scovillei]KAG7073386.1 pre-mRNA-processing ATP-dependent RNA helicase prp5 [Colletotrichum scovillei]